METNIEISPTFQRTVERMLTARFGMPISVIAMEAFPYSRVARCWLEVDGSDFPPTVIARVLRDGPTRSDIGRIYNEQAALEFLSSIDSTLVPRFVAADAVSGILISGDLGQHPSLLDLLLGDDRAAARYGLLAFARGLGRLHAQTIGHAAAVHERRTRLGPVDPSAEFPSIHQTITGAWEQVQHAVHELGLPHAHAVANDVKELVRILAVPSEEQVLSNGDPSPVNCMVAADEVRFFDFEDAAFRHPLIDASVLRFLYPAGGPAWRLPPSVTNEIEAAYRDELGRMCPLAFNDARYEHEVAAASAAWMIRRMARLARVDAGPDRDIWPLLPPGWSGPIPMRSRRQQLVSIIENCIASLHRAGTLPAFTAWCETMVIALRARWPEATETTPLYPAFRQ